MTSRLENAARISLSQAISICRYFLSDQKPDEGLRIIVALLETRQNCRLRIRREGQRCLESNEPELAALLFRALLQTKLSNRQPDEVTPSSGKLTSEEELLEQLDVPHSHGDHLYIDEQAAKRHDCREFVIDSNALNTKESLIDASDKQSPSAVLTEENQTDTFGIAGANTSESAIDNQEPLTKDAEPADQLEADTVGDDDFDFEDLDWPSEDIPSSDATEDRYSDNFEQPDDWAQYIEDAHEFEEAPTREELQEVETSKSLTREQRSSQKAIELVKRFDLDKHDFELLKEIFSEHSWGATKAALVRQLQRDVSVNELQLAHELRDMWEASPEYSLSFGRYPHLVLSWPLAVEIIRSFRGEPDIAELDFFLWNAFDIWYASPHLLISFPSFRDYVKARINIVDQDRICDNAMDWTNGFPINAMESEPVPDSLNNSPKVNDLREFGLLPVRRLGLVDKVNLGRWHDEVEGWATPKEYERRLESRESDE